MTKVTRHGAQLAIADMARITGLTFGQPDRLTRAEANQVLSWAKQQPLVLRVITDRGHPENASLRFFKDHLDYFISDHPQDQTGAPAVWTEGRLLQLDAPIAGMTPAEAEARLAWARTTQEYRDGYFDGGHPDHATLVKQTSALIERAASQPAEPAPAAVAPGSEAGQSPPAVDAKALIAQLTADPAYRDPQHLSHKAAVAAVTAAYAAAYPEPGTAASSVVSPAQPSAQQRMRDIREHPAYLNGRHPEHASKVAEMTAAYEAEYAPSPAAAPSGAGQ